MPSPWRHDQPRDEAAPPTCAGCCSRLGPGEHIYCDECQVGMLEQCLRSEAWRRARGPAVVAEFERELAVLKES